MKKIFVSDVCDTLFYSNTTYDFIRYWVSKRGSSWQRLLLYLYTGKTSPLFYLFIAANKLFREDFHKRLTVRLLKGCRSEMLEAGARAFYRDFLTLRKVAPTFERLRKHAEQGDEVILISSSIEPVIKVIGEELQCRTFASRLEYASGTATGNFTDLTGRKHQLLKTVLGSYGPVALTAMSDNLSDRQLLEMAGKRIVVVHSPKQLRRWGNLEAEFINVKQDVVH